MACKYTYLNKVYSEDEFRNLLMNTDLEKLHNENNLPENVSSKYNNIKQVIPTTYENSLDDAVNYFKNKSGDSEQSVLKKLNESHTDNEGRIKLSYTSKDGKTLFWGANIKGKGEISDYDKVIRTINTRIKNGILTPNEAVSILRTAKLEVPKDIQDAATKIKLQPKPEGSITTDIPQEENTTEVKPQEPIVQGEQVPQTIESNKVVSNDNVGGSKVKVSIEKGFDYIEKEVPNTSTAKFFSDKKLITDGVTDINDEGNFVANARRYGSEFGDKSRGGTWYEIPAYEGQKSSYEAGWWGTREANMGVGGKEEFQRKVELKNPYFVDWGGHGEAKVVLKIANDILGKETTAKLKKGITGAKAEKAFAKIEKAISDELSKKGYDGIVIYDSLSKGTKVHPKQTFVFDKSESQQQPEVPKTISEQKVEPTLENNPPIEQDYSKWKRNNVAYRGVKEIGKTNERGSGMLGEGLYTAPSSNKGMTKEYGERYFVVNGLPKNPKVFSDLNKWEIWAQNNLFNKYSKNEFPDIREFNKNTTIKDEMLKMGYDGIEIKGRETVNFKPENVKYFKTEDEVKDYHNQIKSLDKTEHLKTKEETNPPTEQKAEVTQEGKSGLQTAKERLALAKQKAKEAYGNLGIDPFEAKKKQAEADRELLDSYVEVAKEAIKQGINNAVDFAKEIGENLSDKIQQAWDVANGKVKYDDAVNSFKAYEGGGVGERQFTQRVMDSPDVPDEVKVAVAKNLQYIQQANALTLEEANSLIDKVGEEQAQHLITTDNTMNPAVRATVGQILIKRFSDFGDKAKDEESKNYYYDKAIDTANFVADKLATEAGRMIQSFSMFDKLSPQGQLRAAAKEKAELGKRKINKAKKNIDKIGDRFQDANKEAVEEVLKGKDLKDAVEKTKATRTSKAKDKVAKAREKRKTLIDKFKTEKNKPKLFKDKDGNDVNIFTKGAGLSDEGVKLVAQIAKTYIDEGIGQVEVIVEKIKAHLEDIAGAKIGDEFTDQLKNIADTQLSKSDNTLINQGLKDLNVKVADVVRRHYTVAEKVKTALADKLVKEAGLDGDEAKELAKKVQEAFDRVATRKKAAILTAERKRFDRIQNRLKTGNKIEPKALHDEIIKYSNLGAFTNEEMADVIAKKLGTGRLTPEQANEIIRLSNRIQTAPEGSPKREATEDLLSYKAQIAGTSVGEVAQGIWYANVLSGYMTHAKNIISTFFNGTTFAAAEMLRDPRSIPYLLSGAVKGTIRRGLPEALNTLKTGRSPIHIAKIEVPNILERTQFSGGMLHPANYLKFVTRAMVAEDVLGFQGLKEMRATQLALRQAKKEGLNPLSKAAWNRVNEILLNTKERYDTAHEQATSEGLSGQRLQRRLWELMEQNRPQEMVDDSYGFAAKGTFNHDTEGSLGALTDAFSKSLDITVKGTRPLRFVVPFTRIVTNVVNNALDFSPIGLLRAARGVRGFEGMKDKYHVLTPEEKAQLVAKASLGISLTAGMAALAQTGQIQITGGGTGDYRKDEQLRQSGWQPYSIKIGDRYYSYQYTPLVFNLTLLGDFYDHDNYDTGTDEEGALTKLELSAWQASQLMADMTWIGSTSTLMSALGENNPNTLSKNVEKSLSNSAKSFAVPNAYSQLAKAYEAIKGIPQKQTYTLKDRLVQDVPVARDRLNNKLNALGNEIPTDANIFTSKTIPDKYWDFLNSKKVWISKPNQGTVIVFDNATQKDRPITNDEYYNFIKLRGEKIKAQLDPIIENEKDISKEELQKKITTISRNATTEAKDELFSPKDKSKKESTNGKPVQSVTVPSK